VADVLERLRERGLGDLPVVLGGIIPPEDAEQLRSLGVCRVYTPKDFDLTEIMSNIVQVVEESASAA
jgi:(2R)-ethylmalonyl-CoA mutase